MRRKLTSQNIFRVRYFININFRFEQYVACKRILERDPWIVFRNDVVPPSWTLILPESWDESKSDFKGEVDGFKIFFVAFQDGGHDQCTSEFSLKNACSAGYSISQSFISFSTTHLVSWIFSTLRIRWLNKSSPNSPRKMPIIICCIARTRSWW